MSKPDLGRIIAQTMAKPVEGRTIETITDEILDAQKAAKRSGFQSGASLGSFDRLRFRAGASPLGGL